MPQNSAQSNFTKQDLIDVIKDLGIATKDDVAKAISDNNIKLFEVLPTKQEMTKAISENNKLIEANTKKAISENNKLIEANTKKAISENNIKIFKNLVTKDEMKNYPTKDEFHEAINKLQVTIDKTYGIVKKMSEEQEVISHKVTNHETRITKIEKVFLAN